MMKSLRCAIFALSICSINSAIAGEDLTAQYLRSFGSYLGYDLTDNISTLNDSMFDYTVQVVTSATTGQNLLYAVLRSIPINANFRTFFTSTDYDYMNDQT